MDEAEIVKNNGFLKKNEKNMKNLVKNYLQADFYVI